MGRFTRAWLLLPRPVRRFPPDLAVVAGIVAVSVLVATAPGLRESVLRVALGAAFVLFVPGYAITAAFFPEASGTKPVGGRLTSGVVSRTEGGVTPFERAVFSVGLSVMTVPLAGLVVNFTPWDVGFASLVFAVGALTLAATAVAAVRRRRLPADERFRVPYEAWYASVRSELFEPTSRFDAALNAVLVAAVLVAAVGGAYAVLGPQDDQSYTEFYLLGENETGDLVADSYPETIGNGENDTVVVGIANHEHRPMEYTVLVRLQRVQVAGDDATVVDSQQVAQFRANVGVDETVRRRPALRPAMTGERLRLQYLLYADEPSADPSAENAYRSAHLWVNATAA